MTYVDTPPSPQDLYPPWSNGLNIRDARGQDWFRLMVYTGADVARLCQIAVARHYHPNWMSHVLPTYSSDDRSNYPLDVRQILIPMDAGLVTGAQVEAYFTGDDIPWGYMP